MVIDYRRAFERLVDQIKTEEQWAKEQYDRDCENAKKEKESLATYGALRYDRGMTFAYESIRRLAEQLEDEAFKFEEDEVDEEDE